MRALAGFALAAVVLAAICMPIALIGRAADWSPYALTMLGAGAGFVFGLMLTLTLYTLEEDDDPEHNAEHYRNGWRAGYTAAEEDHQVAGGPITIGRLDD